MLILKLYPKDFLKPLLCGFLLVFLFIGNVQGNEPQVKLTPEERGWLAEHPDIKLGFTDTFEPYLLKGDKGKNSGILVDFLSKLNQRLGTQFVIEIDSWPTTLEKVKNKELSGVMAIARETAEAHGLLQTESILSVHPVFYTNSNAPFSIEKLDDIRGRSVAILKSAQVMENILEPYKDAVSIVRLSSNLECLQMLFKGEVDIAFGLTTMNYLIGKHNLSGINAAFPMWKRTSEVAMGVRPDWPELIGILNKGLDSISENEWNTIFAKWSFLTPKPSEPLELMPEEQAWLAQNQTVRVRIADWPPYLILKGNEPPSGIVIEYLKLIREKTGITFKNEVSDQPFAEFLERMKQRKGPDMAAIIVPTPEREQYLSFSQTYISSPYVIFIREQDKPILDINGLAGKTLAVPRGFDVQERLARDYPEIRLVLFDSDEAALQSVATGQSDAYIGNLTVASHIIHRRGFSGLQVAASGPFKDQSLSMGNRNDWPELTSIIDKALAGITEEEKTAIRNKYLAIKYEQGINKAEMMKWVLIVAAAAFGVVLVFVLWNNQLSRKIRERTSELSESEEKYRGLVDNAIAGVFVSTPDGRFTFVNDAMARMFDFDSPEQMMAEGSLKRWRNLKDRERMRTELQQHGSVTNFETGAISHTDRNIQVLFSAKLIGNDIVGMGMDISDRQRAEKKLQHYQQRLKALALKLTIAEEKERHRIAQNLHDHISQSLALARIQIASARELTSEPRLADRLDDISQTLFDILENIDQLMFELSSPLVDEISLSSGISEWLEGQLESKHSLRTEFIDNIIEGRGTIQDKNVQAILFRNVKELLVNVVKHARANKVCVRLENENSSMKVFVEDDGIGFDSRKTISEGVQIGGFGLFSIQERMADLGGSLKIMSEPGKGCRAILCVPLEVDNK